MTLHFPGPRRSAREPNAPYCERADASVGSLDASLLDWIGDIASKVPAALTRRPLIDLVRRAEALDEDIRRLSDRGLRDAAYDVRAKLARSPYATDGLARAFALTREAARRHLGKRHHVVQLLGGAAMMRGAIAEMQTGEGKTLTALLPAIAGALANRPVHVVTVNDYLSCRDAEHLRPVYEALGLTVGLVEQGQEKHERRAAYACDVTYCTNKDLVFDYLRDRMALGDRRARGRLSIDRAFGFGPACGAPLLLRGLHLAIVDEADSIMIDEARTPLILAGPDRNTPLTPEIYVSGLQIARGLSPCMDFRLSQEEHSLQITEKGETAIAERASGMQGLWAIRRARNELIQQALSALHLFRKDIDYIVVEGKVQIVDKNTGRVMPDRSWERGLHQMIEAKEGCAFTEPRKTLAGITYQRFFRRYLHLCGMTGTAMEAAGELRAIYGLKVMRIPTHRPSRRRDCGSRLFLTSEQKFHAVARAVGDLTRDNRAVLVGTKSVAASEAVGAILREAGLAPAVLNARHDHAEAELIAEAGHPGRVTVATNMAGRGTDIELHPAVKEAGGLHVILTDFHESARIDRQLFGRAGRQGDPGSFECVTSLEDELFSRFGGRLIGGLARYIRRAGFRELPGAACQLLRFICQKIAGRHHCQARRRAFLDDQNSRTTLAFAGTRE